ncbi:MAG TPA: Flp pilus assembly protein CpaB [Alphaproteobacteria bacterium]|nr:Flp pilus assembly protein CpaB [Alphaproteobacteria bacterium]HNS44367.1 Flp pilus assembly protein CpaB [Alphaproteobacteria bacterium]
MNKNILIVMGGGFLVALLVAIIVQASFGSKKEGMVELAVATRSLKAGDPVNEANFKWQEWPEESVFQGAVLREKNKKVTDIAKGRLRRNMESGEPLLQASLTTAGKTNILAAAMDPGMRAMAIKVSAESMVGGFISPGDRVDVILTYQVKVSADARDEVADKVSRHATQTVLENVKVLAIDQNASKEDANKAKVGRTVTLEVDTKAAERLALASEMGDLSLVLRALGDDQVTDPKEKSFTTDVEVSDVLQEIGKIKKSSGGSSNIVRVYNGQNVENVNVRH